VQIVSQINKKPRKSRSFSIFDRAISAQICDAVFVKRIMSWK
jgi:hypothetical protein